jgi:mono/diheme cytochrome c family protein
LFFRFSGEPTKQSIKVGRGPFRPVANMSAQWNRGAYLVEAVSHCAECHTPRNSLGAPKLSLWLAGGDIPMNGRTPPNITPDDFTGKGRWTKEDWLRFLSTGMDPGGGYPSGEMAQVIANTSALTQADREAMVNYLMTLTPVRRDFYEP